MQTSQEDKLKQKLLEEQFALLQGTITEAENIIQDAVAKLDDPVHVRCTSSPGHMSALWFPTIQCLSKNNVNTCG